jgi:hypothetical protein
MAERSGTLCLQPAAAVAGDCHAESTLHRAVRDAGSVRRGDHSCRPGAKEARVADYIDLLLSEEDDSVVLQWMGGLAALDEDATRRFGRPFARLTSPQVDTLLTAISANEEKPDLQTPLEAFFVTTKRATIQGYYTSEIGIHRELRYKGNQIIKEFVGCHTEDGKDCPHCGQKAGR